MGGRDSGERRVLDGAVAVAALDAEAAHMMLVVERHRLLNGDVDAGKIGRADEDITNRDQTSDHEDSAKDGCLRDYVGAGVKDLSHLDTLSSLSRHPGEIGR